MRTTLKDIAQDTGLSISTVSRALNRIGGISHESVIKVQESAYRLKYPIDDEHKLPEIHSTAQIALVTNFKPGEFYSSFYNGFLKAASHRNLHIALLNVNEKDGSLLSFIRLIKKSFDAAVLFLPGLSKSDYQSLITDAGGFPMISAAPLATPVMDTIAFDNYSGGYLIAKHFHDRGYRKIGFIQGPTSKVETHLRKNGFLDYCDHHDLQLVWNFSTDYDISSGREAYTDFKNSDNKPEAIFAGNDSLAIGFIHAAIKDGCSVPGDVAIAGYDNIPMSEYQNPSLTTIDTPFTELGKHVLDSLSRVLSEPLNDFHHSGSTRLIPVRLVERESS